MKALEIDALTRYRFLSHVRLSPDSQMVAFVVKEANMDENRYNSNIWLCHLDSGRIVQLTTSGKDLVFDWSDDGRQIFFISQRREPDTEDGKQSSVYQIGVDGGEAVLVHTLPLEIESIRTLDSRRLLFTSTVDLPQQSQPMEEHHQDDLIGQTQKEEENDVHVLDEIPFWRNGKGVTNKKRKHLFLLNIESGETSDLTEGNLNLQGFDLRGNQVVLYGVEFTDKDPVSSDLYLLNLENYKLERLTDGTRIFGQPRFLSEVEIIAPANDRLQYGLGQNSELFLLHRPDNRLENLTPGWDKSVVNSVGSDCRLGAMEANRADNGRVFFHMTEKDSCTLCRLIPGGQVERVVNVPGAIDGFDARGDTIVYVAFRGNRLQELYRWENGREVQFTQFNEKVLKGVTLSTPESFKVERDDGVSIDAWIIKPTALQVGKRYPAILEIHGGPKTVSSHTFFHEYQLLANQGYVVFFCNPRGSDGKGNAFADIRGRYGTIDYQDIMAVVDHVLANYDFVDPDRLGVSGGSYGGFMTNWIIGHTDRFKAAVSQRSISNWLSFSYTTDIGYFFGPDQLGVTPWEDMEKVWFHSPLRYADRVVTPTLFIHSAEDYRCWLPEGLQMFSALRFFGVEARLVIFNNENHELSRGGKPRQRIRRLDEILKWFDTHL